MNSFHIGQKVLCIDASPTRRYGATGLTEGATYVVRALSDGYSNAPFGVHLVGIRFRQWIDGTEIGFHPSRFRAAEGRKTDISVFTKIVERQPGFISRTARRIRETMTHD